MVTATEIAAFALCPRMYAYRAVWSVPGRVWQAERLSSKPDEDQPDQPESFEFPAAEWGTLVHKIMERVPLDADEAEIRKVVEYSPGAPKDKARIERLVEMVKGALKLPIMERLRGNVDEIKREYRILGRLPGTDEVVLGILDVVSAGDGKITLIDYKSGKVKKEDAESKAKDYETQMAVYAALAGSRWGVDPSDVDTHLIFTDPDPPIDNVVKVGSGMIDRASEVVRRLSDWSRESRFTADASPEKCNWCDFSDICRFSTVPK
jgi:RecB family exonuclease